MFQEENQGLGSFFETLNAGQSTETVNFTDWKATSHQDLLASFRKEDKSKSVTSKSHDVGMILEADEDAKSPMVVSLLAGGPAER